MSKLGENNLTPEDLLFSHSHQDLYKKFPICYYRAKELSNYQIHQTIPDVILQNIDFSSSLELNHSTIKENKISLQLFYTKPAIYIDESREFRIVDLCLIDIDADRGVRCFKKLIEKCAEKALLCKKIITESIVPKLVKIDHIYKIQGRGSLFDSERHFCPLSTCDLMLFFNNSISKSEVKELLHPEPSLDINTYMIFYEFQKEGFYGVLEPLFSKRQKGVPHVVFDIFNKLDLTAYFYNKNKLDSYYVNAFSEHKNILFERN